VSWVITGVPVLRRLLLLLVADANDTFVDDDAVMGVDVDAIIMG
jgi:hypothetical protein